MKIKWILLFSSIVIVVLMTAFTIPATPYSFAPKVTPPILLFETPGIASNQQVKHVNLKGTITAVDNSNITLILKDGSSVTILLSAETHLRIPTVKKATIDDLVVGMTVMVQAIQSQDNSLYAKAVVLIPGKPAKVHHVGIVTDYMPGVSITIQAPDEQPTVYMINEKTKILPLKRVDLLVVGARVTIISPRDVSILTQIANGIVVHPVDIGD